MKEEKLKFAMIYMIFVYFFLFFYFFGGGILNNISKKLCSVFHGHTVQDTYYCDKVNNGVVVAVTVVGITLINV